MVTIVGNGMGEYDFSNITGIDFESFDAILCDVNFQKHGTKILKLKYKQIKEYILQHYREQNILYIVTGSPLFFSAGVIVASLIPSDYVKIINNQSSLDYMAEKLAISYTKINSISLHGRSQIDLEQFLTNQYTFILCDKDTIQRVQDALYYIDLDKIEITIGYRLGYSNEIIKIVTLEEIKNNFDLNEPYVLIIKKNFTTSKPISEDEQYETQRGMITKKYKRNLSLQNLDLYPNQILWDIGAGSGSCGIEAYKRYKVKIVLFEKQPLRYEFIEKNLKRHYVVDSLLIKGEAQDKFDQITSTPQRIFVGGGGYEVIKKLPYLYDRLDNDGVMLINAITLKNLTQMLTVLNDANIEYEVHSLSITTYKGKLDLVEPERELFAIKIVKKVTI